MVDYEVLETHVRVSAVGETSPEEWLKLLSELQRIVGERGMDAVLDFSRQENAIPMAVIDTLIGRIGTKPRRRRWAFVVTRPASTGLVSYARRSLNVANIEVGTFDDVADAEHWITESTA